MEFKYKEDVKELECVAYMTHMEGSPYQECLVLKDSHSGQTVWLYYDGEVMAQSGSLWGPEEVTKKFYKGDEVTIKF